MRRRAVTIRDIAKKAGVAVSTVSYVLNGHPDHVGQTTRDHILSVARELHYRPNALARSMISKKTSTIGLIITELENPLFIPILSGAEAVLREEGYQIILASAQSVEREMQAIDTLRAQQVDGIIVMSLSRHYPTGHLRRLYDEEFPFIVINRDLDDPDIYQIQFDEGSAGRIATEHLIHTGRQRIGIITGPMDDIPNHRKSAVERYAGWRKAMEAAGLPINSAWIVPGHYTFIGGYQAVYDLFAQRSGESPILDALFASSDMMAIGALKALADLGVKVPYEVSLITIGDPPYAAFTIPALTTMVIPIAESGQLAAQMLVAWLKAGHPTGPKLSVLPFTIQIRESCGIGTSPYAMPTSANEAS